MSNNKESIQSESKVIRRYIDTFKNMRLNKRVVILSIISIIIPSIIFIGTFFGYTQRNVINNEKNYMKYLLDEQRAHIIKNIEMITVVERFLESDAELIELLRKVENNELSDLEISKFLMGTVRTLERVIESNTQLNQIRIYVENSKIQNILPIIYPKEEMKKLEWAKKWDYRGWYFGYNDPLDESVKKNEEVLGHITLIKDPSTQKTLATMEVTMSMETMFSNLDAYEDENIRVWFNDKEGKLHGGHLPTELEEIVQRLNSFEREGGWYQNIRDETLMIGYIPIEELEGTLLISTNITQQLVNIEYLTKLIVIGIGMVLVIFIILLNQIIDRIFRKFYSVLYSIQEIQKGNLSVVVDEEGNDEVSELGAQINKMSRQIKVLMEENVHREILIKNSEIKALQNQINAHFIYNVLESIKMMAEIEEKYDISDATTALGRLLRYTMKWDSNQVTIKQEIEYIKNYLRLINLRFDYEISLSIELSEMMMNQYIPKMSLQPLVENAIHHGLEDIAEDSTIYIRGVIVRNTLNLEVIDTGKGISKEELNQLKNRMTNQMETSGGSGSGIGLKNVYDRVKMSFGEAYTLSIQSKENYYTKIEIKVPMTTVESVEG